VSNELVPIALAHELADAPSIASFLDNLRSQGGPAPLAPRKFTVAKLNYEHPDLGDDPRPDPHAYADIALARKIGETLQYHYGGHPWYVEVEHIHGIAKVSIPSLMGWTSYFVIHLDRLASDPGMKIVVKAGGEILERYRIPRSGFDFFAFADACKKVDYISWRKSAVPE
jgi:hypothetical protein